MANIAAEAILTRARELIDGAYGDYRVISASRFSAGVHPEMSDSQQSNRAVVDAGYDVLLGEVTRHPSSPTIYSSIALYSVQVIVTTIRTLESLHTLTEATRDSVVAAAVVDGDQLCQCLCYPGNMTATNAGSATGLVSGTLLFDSSSGQVVKQGDEELSFVRTTHAFTGVVQIEQQVAQGLAPENIDSVRSWFRADLGVTLNGATVSAWADQIGSADGVQSTANQQPTYNLTDTDVSNRPSIDFDGVNDNLVLGSTSSFNYLHDGTGGSFFIVLRTPSSLPNGSILDSNATTGGNVGIYMYQTSGGTVELAATTGTANAWSNTSALSLATSTNYAIIVTYSTAAGYAIYRNSTTAVGSGAQANTPSVANATYALRMCQRSLGDSSTAFTVLEFATFDEVLSTNEISGLLDYCERYGI